MKEKCIETAAQSFIEIIQEALDKGIHSIGIFTDLTKTYDTLNHKVLLEKLSSYGIGGKLSMYKKSLILKHAVYLYDNQIYDTVLVFVITKC
jgi:hypothetical protein